MVSGREVQPFHAHANQTKMMSSPTKLTLSGMIYMSDCAKVWSTRSRHGSSARAEKGNKARDWHFGPLPLLQRYEWALCSEGRRRQYLQPDHASLKRLLLHWLAIPRQYAERLKPHSKTFAQVSNETAYILTAPDQQQSLVPKSSEPNMHDWVHE